MKELRMENGDVVDAEECDHTLTDIGIAVVCWRCGAVNPDPNTDD